MKRWRGLVLTVLIVTGFALFVRSTLVSHANQCDALAASTRQTIALLGTCESDADCTIVQLSCPFDCDTAVRRDRVQETFQAASEYNKSCMMVCPECPKATGTFSRCEAGRCRP